MPYHIDTRILWQDRVTNIDRRQCERVVPMKVLVLGLSRTGTNSLRTALERFGYNSTYHGYAAALENPRDCEMWLAALRAKFERTWRPFGMEELDKLLGHCQAVTDIPAACFAKELIEAYPEAKVILTNRDVDEWHASVLRGPILGTYNTSAIIASSIAWLFRSNSRWSRPVFVLIWEKFFKGFKENGKDVYRAHYRAVRSTVPKERPLEYHVREGWESLCKFLEQDVPRYPFPNGNDEAATRRKMREVMVLEMSMAAGKLAVLLTILIMIYNTWRMLSITYQR